MSAPSKKEVGILLHPSAQALISVKRGSDTPVCHRLTDRLELCLTMRKRRGAGGGNDLLMRLLVVEDDSQLGEALMLGLRQRGHAVDWFRDGAPADAALGGAPYDAMVLDLGLPGGDGIVWLRRWRGQGKALPVLILTARDSVQQRIAGLDAGADDYLIKPIALDELAARLRALLRRASGRAQAVWQHGTLEYDPAAKRVRWTGRSVDLTGRELALLEVLMAHPQRVLSKEFLKDKLYDWSGTEPEGNALEVHIHNLRRKLAPAVVRTVRGLGYALGSCETNSRPAP